MKALKIPKKFIAKKQNKQYKKCGACGGSGCYDATGSPKCSACDGTGIEKDKQ